MKMAKHNRRSRRLSVEHLESRELLAVFVVNSTGDPTEPGKLTLRDAIMMANATPNMPPGPDVIMFDPALNGQTITLTDPSELVITESVTIAGNGQNPGDRVTIDGNGHRILRIDDQDLMTRQSVSLQNLILHNGHAPGDAGGAIRSKENLELNNVRITGSSARSGGAVYVERAHLNIVNGSVLTGNSATENGGAVSFEPVLHTDELNIFNSTINSNSASLRAGGVESVGGKVEINQSEISANTSGSGGGGVDFSLPFAAHQTHRIDIVNSTLNDNIGEQGGAVRLALDSDGAATVVGSTMVGNSATALGGAVNVVADQQASLSVDQATMRQNTAQTGGAISIDVDPQPGGGIAVDVSDSTLEQNTAAAGNGGAIEASLDGGSMRIGGTIIRNNSASDQGGGVHVFGRDGAAADITNSTLQGNTAGQGGGVASELQSSASTSIDASVLDGNEATTAYGGGAFFRAVDADVTLSSSKVSGNAASGSIGYGGGLHAEADGDASVEVTDTTVSGNSAYVGGGMSLRAIAYGIRYAEAIVIQSTISGNFAEAGAGMLLAAYLQGLIGVRHTTVATNMTLPPEGAPDPKDSGGGPGGGIFTRGYGVGEIELDHTIVGNNSPDDTAGAEPITANRSLIEINTNVTISGANNLMGVDPVLGPLGDHGGQTETHIPLTSSPVIDAGDAFVSNAPFLDQRGFPRVINGDGDLFTVIDLGATEVQPLTVDGDFNDDGEYNCQDIDALMQAIAVGLHQPDFDLTGDNLVNLGDRDVWLTEAGAANLPSGNAFLLADATLDGVVDGSDFIAWNSNKFTNNTDWCAGNFNGDLVIDGLDFLIWNNHKFQASLLRTATIDSVMQGESAQHGPGAGPEPCVGVTTVGSESRRDFRSKGPKLSTSFATACCDFRYSLLRLSIRPIPSVTFNDADAHTILHNSWPGKRLAPVAGSPEFAKSTGFSCKIPG